MGEVMTTRVKPSKFSSEWLQRSARNSIATSISLILLLTPVSGTSALCRAFPDAPQAQQPVNTSGGATQEEEDLSSLEPGIPIEKEITGGESHSYQFMLTAGQFLSGVVEQRGINLLVSLYGPDGIKIADIDSPVGAQGPEPVSLIAETSGTYRL